MMTDKELEKILLQKDYCSKSIKLGWRGEGSLRIKIKKSDISFFLAKKVAGRNKEIKIGTHISCDPRSGIDLTEAMNTAKERSAQLFQIINTHDKGGTLRDLMNGYIDIDLKGAASQYNVRKTVDKHLLNKARFANLCDKPANQCATRELSKVMEVMYQNGIRSTCNKMRSYLHSAYNWGAKQSLNWSDSHTQNDEVQFYIESNPIAVIPTDPSLETAGKKQLSDHEIWLLWHYGRIAMGDLPGRLARLLLAACGPRPEHILRVPWECIHEDESYPYMELYSLKGGRKNKRRIDYIIPLNDLAVRELQELKVLTSGACRYLFPAKTAGRKFIPEQHMSPSSLIQMAYGLNDFCEQNYNISDFHFTFGRIRASVSARMHETKVKKEINRELLFHDKEGVTEKLYDKWEYKKEAAQAWSNYLKQLVSRPYH